MRAVLALPMVSSLMFSDGISGGYMSQEVVALIQQANDETRRKTKTLVRETSEREGLTLDGMGGRIVFLPERPTAELDMLGETPLCDLIVASSRTSRWCPISLLRSCFSPSAPAP